jgi:AcrR family transcriptional regulator
MALSRRRHCGSVLHYNGEWLFSPSPEAPGRFEKAVTLPEALSLAKNKMLDASHVEIYIVSEQSLTKMRTKDQTRELIARTALHLFVEKGIEGATIRDIAAAAGIAEGTLYRHYPGKDALAWDLFSQHYTAFALELQRVQAGHATLRAKVDAMVRHFCVFFDRDPVLFSYLLLAQHGHLQRVTADMPNPVEVLREVLAGGMDRGDIPAGDPNVAAAMVLGIVLQVAIFKIYQRLTQSLADLAENLAAACWRVLAG